MLSFIYWPSGCAEKKKPKYIRKHKLNELSELIEKQNAKRNKRLSIDGTVDNSNIFIVGRLLC